MDSSEKKVKEFTVSISTENIQEPMKQFQVIA